MQPAAHRLVTRLLSSICLLAGLALAAMSWGGLFPATSLACVLSADGELSASFVGLLRQSQWTLAVLVFLAAPLTWWSRGILALYELIFLRWNDRVYFAGLTGVVFASTLLVQTMFFNNLPHVTDAISHIFQAKIFSLGLVFAPAPPCYEHFFQNHIYITQTGRWFTMYPPGHALSLLLPLKLHILWVYGPLATAASAACFSWLVQRFHGRTLGRLCGVLFGLSPLVLLLGGSYMSHVSFMLYALLAIALGTWAIDRSMTGLHATFAAVGAGFMGGMAGLTRPQDLLLVCVPLLAVVLLVRNEVRRIILRTAIMALPGLLLPLVAQGLWNNTVFGTSFALGYGHTSAGSLTPMLGWHLGFSESNPFAKAVHQLIWTATRFDKVLLGWPSSLVLIPLAFLRFKQDLRDWICALGIAAVISFYFIYSYYGFEYEARFYSVAAPFCIVLVARGLQRFVQSVHRWLGRRMLEAEARRSARFMGAVLLLIFTLHGLCFYWPVYIWPRYSGDYEQTSAVIHGCAARDRLHRALVLIDTSGPNTFRYSSGFIYNDPLLTNDVIYARDLGEENRCLAENFPGRAIYQFVPNADWTSGRFERVEF